MSQQHNSNGSRKCWRTARERERLRARFEIRQRVFDEDEDDDNPSSSANQAADVNQLKTFLRQISEGSVSSFSISALAKHHILLAQPVASSLLSEYKITTLCTSRFGREHTQRVLEFACRARKSCTMIEYAALLGEYRVVGALLLGAVDPTTCGEFVDGGHGRKVSRLLARAIMNRFFDCFPLSLSTYIVKRVVDMRLQSWVLLNNGIASGELCFGEPCQHGFSEERFWCDLIEHVDGRTTGDVVLCPVCTASMGSTEDTSLEESQMEDVPPRELCQDSLAKFHALPLDSSELKKRCRKAPKKRAMTSTWQESVLQRLGNSQDVRRDKFWSFVEQGSKHFVLGCLTQGVDVNGLNDYNQTAMYVAVMQGNIELTELLLQYGADSMRAANGGTTPYFIAKVNNHSDIVELLESHGEHNETDSYEHVVSCDADKQVWPDSTRLQVLIPSNIPHPGAGACIIDDLLSTCFLKTLVDIWEALPTTTTDRRKKKNAEICSDRSYLFDVHGIGSVLEAAIRRSGLDKSPKFLKHMRFLHYKHAGSILAPHVDLCRVDTETGKRSTHTFILYLYSCGSGGETILLEDLVSGAVLAKAAPTRGRLLLFPHSCPHSGAEVVDVPKLLLRGEVILS